MLLLELIENLQLGREIEFHYNNDAFLVSYIPDSAPLQFFIWNGSKNVEICRGDLNHILNFEFDKAVCLKNSLHRFSIDYIL